MVKSGVTRTKRIISEVVLGLFLFGFEVFRILRLCYFSVLGEVGAWARGVL